MRSRTSCGRTRSPCASSSARWPQTRTSSTAKIHCAFDEDSDQDLVRFQVEEAVAASLNGRRTAFVTILEDFAVEYAEQVRRDHALFVDAFRAGRIGISAT